MAGLHSKGLAELGEVRGGGGEGGLDGFVEAGGGVGLDALDRLRGEDFGIVWNFIYHPDFGLLNKILGIFGISPIAWLQDPNWAMPAIILMSVWKGLGNNIIIFLTGLQNIPKHLYEAARIDGANRWQQFRHITWPMLSPTTFFIFTMSVIGSFQVFSQVYMMTPRGGPLKSTMVVVYYLYRKAFDQFEFGYALAMAFVLFLIIFACTLFNKLYVEKKVHYS